MLRNLVAAAAAACVCANTRLGSPESNVSNVLNAQGFSVSNVLGSHMVLQRDVPAVIWGFGTPGVTVSAALDGNAQPAVTVDSSGVWRVSLPKQAASLQSHTIALKSSDGGSADLTDILFGDVILCGGQSNMRECCAAAG
jgi:hypothetical protein